MLWGQFQYKIKEEIIGQTAQKNYEQNATQLLWRRILNVAESGRRAQVEYSSVANWKQTGWSNKANTQGKRRHFIFKQMQAHHWAAVHDCSHMHPNTWPLSRMLQSHVGSIITPSTHIRRMLEESTGFPLVHLNSMWSLWGAYSVSFRTCIKAMLRVVMMALFTVQGSAGHRRKTTWLVNSKTRRATCSHTVTKNYF